jgi:sugar O-acyltransferase (sialic acid O-acetyltransferase NeuD family)
MGKNLLIFGTGKIAEAVTFFFEKESNYNICAYICDDDFVLSERFLGRPVVGLSKFEDKYKPLDYEMFVAVGYQAMNQLRTFKYKHFKNLGFTFASHISPSVKGNFSTGENTIVMDGAVIQPLAKFGNNVFVWGGAMVGHHATIGDNCWLTGGCLIGGIAKIGQSTFVGLGAMVGHEIIIGEKCMLGAATITYKSIPAGTVLVAPNTEPHRLNSDQFTRMSTCFRV